jgi:hypothetical protein
MARRNDSDGSSFSIGTTLMTAVAAFAGSIVGNGLRLYLQAKSEHAEQSAHGVDAPTSVELTLTGVITNTVAATALAFAVPGPRPLVGFVVGAGLSAATGDAPDRMLLDLIAGEPDGFMPMDEDIPDGV